MCVRRLQSGCMFRAFDGWLSRVEGKKAAREEMQLVHTALLEGAKVQTYSVIVPRGEVANCKPRCACELVAQL